MVDSGAGQEGTSVLERPQKSDKLGSDAIAYGKNWAESIPESDQCLGKHMMQVWTGQSDTLPCGHRVSSTQ